MASWWRAVVVLGVISIGACGTPEGDCREESRTVGLDEANATGMTARQMGARFHVGDVVWSCSLAWAPLGDQTDAIWSPHDTTTAATASLRWAPDSSATEVTGLSPPGSRLACPPRVEIDLLFDLATQDGGFADSWSARGGFLTSTDHLSVRFDPQHAGGFHGSYTFTLLHSWPVTATTLTVGAFPDRLEGSLVEGTQRMTGPGSGEGLSGEGLIVRVGNWLCEQGV